MPEDLRHLSRMSGFPMFEGLESSNACSFGIAQKFHSGNAKARPNELRKSDIWPYIPIFRICFVPRDTTPITPTLARRSRRRWHAARRALVSDAARWGYADTRARALARSHALAGLLTVRGDADSRTRHTERTCDHARERHSRNAETQARQAIAATVRTDVRQIRPANCT